MADDGLSKLPKFDQYRDPRRPDDPPPNRHSAARVWLIAGAGMALGAFIGGVPEFLSLQSRMPLVSALAGSLWPATPWACGGLILGLVLALVDMSSHRDRD